MLVLITFDLFRTEDEDKQKEEEYKKRFYQRISNHITDIMIRYECLTRAMPKKQSQPQQQMDLLQKQRGILAE